MLDCRNGQNSEVFLLKYLDSLPRDILMSYTRITHRNFNSSSNVYDVVLFTSAALKSPEEGLSEKMVLNTVKNACSTYTK